MKEIKIFFASSIHDFAAERKRIASFLTEMNNQLIDTGTFLNAKFCEEMDNSVAKFRKQDDYNELIRSSNIVIFFIKDECRSYTMEEFEVAISSENSSNLLVFKTHTPVLSDSVNKVKNMALSNSSAEYIVYEDFNTVEENIHDCIIRCINETPNDGTTHICDLKKIRCYLVCSEDYQNETNEIIRFALNINERLIRKNYYLYVDTYPSIHGHHKAVSIDKNVDNSNLAFFILFDKVEEYIGRQFDLALESFNKKGTPKIFTYFYQSVNEDESITQFKNFIDKKIKHFYSLFFSVDSIKLRLFLQISEITDSLQEIRIKDSILHINTDQVMSLEMLPIIFNNKKLHELKQDLVKIDEMYQIKANDFSEDTSKIELISELAALNDARDKTNKKIEEEETSLLKMLIEMNRSISRGKLDEMQKRAYRYIEDGDIANAAKILNKHEVDEVVKPVLRQGIDTLLSDAGHAINMYCDAIAIQKLLNDSTETAFEIEGCYKEIMALITDFPMLNCSPAIDFAEFYDEQNNPKAEDIYKCAEYLYTDPNHKKSDEECQKLYSSFGCYLLKQERYAEAGNYFERNLYFATKLYVSDNIKYANIYSEACLCYAKTNDKKKYIEIGLDALKKVFDLRKTKEDAYALAKYYKVLGINSNDGLKAMEYYRLAIDILKTSCEENSLLADIYLSLAEAIRSNDSQITDEIISHSPHKITHILEAAKHMKIKLPEPHRKNEIIERYIKKAIGIYEKLLQDQENSEILIALGDAYNNMAVLFSDNNNYYWAIKYLQKSEKIYEKLYLQNPMKYGLSLGENYIQLGSMQDSMGNPKKAICSKKKGLEIIDGLYRHNKSRFATKLSWAYFEMGCLYNLMNEKSEMLRCFAYSIKVIQDTPNEEKYSLLSRIGEILIVLEINNMSSMNSNAISMDEIVFFEMIFKFCLEIIDNHENVMEGFGMGSLCRIGMFILHYYETNDPSKVHEWYDVMIDLDEKRLKTENLPVQDKFAVYVELAALYGKKGDIETGQNYILKSVELATDETI